MKPEELKQQLVVLVEKKEITYKEHNFRNAGINVQSGLCVVNGEKIFIMDKHKKVKEKNLILAAFLSQFLDEDVYLLPLVRKFIEANADIKNG
jgi:hypothetical protein